MCYSAAEYACRVWSRSCHAKKMDTVLNTVCRDICGCLKLTRVDDLYLLCGIAPQSTRRHVTSCEERAKQELDHRHPLYQHEPAKKRLKSRSSFLHDVQPLKGNTPTHRIEAWSRHIEARPQVVFQPKRVPATRSSLAMANLTKP